MKKNNPSLVIQWLTTHHLVLFLCAIVMIGAFLRFYDFIDLLRFNNDQVRDIKIISSMIAENDFPLLGPKAGGTTFKLGPAFYYMEYLSAIIFGNTPHGIALFVPLLGTLSIILFYLLLKKYFFSYIALILTLLYATSFYAIKYTRFAWNPNVIPFFLFAFFLTLLHTLNSKKKHLHLWFIVLGIITGIAMQLHTTLLILLPILIACAHGLNYHRTKNISFPGIILTCGIICILLSPMLIYDIQNNGKNITAFFHGSEAKSTKNGSLVENVLLDGQLFVQSTAYVITGTEPTKNWIHMKKLILSRNYAEITTAILSSTFFLFCLYLFIKKTKAPKTSSESTMSHHILFSMTFLCFLLFLPIAHEINTRFFIILIFLPFIFIGLLFQKILRSKIIPHHLGIAMIALCTCTLVSANIYTYVKTYDLTRTDVDSNSYGGISVQELTALTQYMKSQTKNPSDNIHLIPHTYGQSLRYIAHNQSISLSSTAPNNVPTDALAFYLSDKTDDTTLPKKLSPCFDLRDTKIIFRFRIFTLQKTATSCT